MKFNKESRIFQKNQYFIKVKSLLIILKLGESLYLATKILLLFKILLLDIAE